MIHIDLCLPAVHREVECFCDEQLEINAFMVEILRLLPEVWQTCQTGVDAVVENKETDMSLCLCDLTAGTVLEKGLSLSQNAVYSGHRLMLI